jgi:hypothetical protein
MTLAIVPGKTDRELADDIRARLTEALKPALVILTEAKKEGLDVALSIGPIYDGTVGITALKIIKEL